MITHSDFHLTGSRYFGTARPDSDWDYVAPANLHTAEFLMWNGFQRTQLLPAGKNLHSVWRRRNCHVQLRANVAVHLIAQRIARALGLGRILRHKRFAKLFWQSIYSVARRVHAD